MFAKLASYQLDITTRIMRELADGTFPHAVLFHGTRYSCRMSIALEICRILSCRKDGLSTCDCSSCKAFGSLETPNTLIISVRDHQSVLETAMKNLVDQRTSSARRFLIHSVRVMLLQYHGALLEEKDQKSAAAFGAAATVDELLLSIEKINDETTEKQIAKLMKELRDSLKPLFTQSRKSAALTIAQVRAIQEWTGRTSLDALPRFVILEGIEQSAEGARNSLLKLLEDPPEHTYLFLITENVGRILPTILSRVRRYYIPPLTENAKTLLLAKEFFADGEAYDTLETYFLCKAGVDCTLISSLSEKYLQGAVGAIDFGGEDLHALLNTLDETGQHEYFLRDLMGAVQQEFVDGRLHRSVVMKMVPLINDMANRGLMYNQNKKLTLEALFYQLREVL
jgi:DNA polymerase III delta prime subunit